MRDPTVLLVSHAPALIDAVRAAAGAPGPAGGSTLGRSKEEAEVRRIREALARQGTTGCGPPSWGSPPSDSPRSSPSANSSAPAQDCRTAFTAPLASVSCVNQTFYSGEDQLSRFVNFWNFSREARIQR